MNHEPKTNPPLIKDAKQTYRVWPIGMTGRVALILLCFTLLPMIFTGIMIEKGMLLPGKNLYIAVPVFFTVLIVPLSKTIAYNLVNRDLKMINTFCNKIKQGEHNIHFDVPDEKENEDDLLILLRNLNWMSRNLEMRYLNSMKTIDKTRHEYNEMKKQASTDPLTGLFNRRYLELVSQNDRRKLKADSNSLSLIYIDCDRFKKVNDTLGHKTGDKLLVCLADCIRRNIRLGHDVPVRLGGDEFAVLLPSADQELTEKIAERIRRLYNKLKIGDTSLSIGVVTAQGLERVSMVLLDTLIHCADKQVYRAKHAGGDSIFTDVISANSIQVRSDKCQYVEKKAQ